MNYRCELKTVVVLFLFLINAVAAQISTEEHWVNGFSKYIAGENLQYHSCHPEANLSILIRSLNDKDYIEWETDTVAQNYIGQTVTFVWIGGYSVGSTKAPQTFSLYANDKPLLIFSTSPQDKREEWSIKNNDAQLHFKLGKIDAAGDFFGYFSLTLPTKELSANRTLRIKVKGDASGFRDWYMTMQYPLIPKIRITPEKIVNKDSNGKLSQQVRVSIDNFGPSLPVKILTDGYEAISSNLNLGVNDFYVLYEKPKSSVEKIIEINIDGQTTEHKVIIDPTKKITFYLIPEAHVDIGYTDIQHEVEKKHWRNYDKAIEYSKRSADYPEESVFKWNTEALWAVKSYLEEFPEKRAQFIDAVKKGWMNLDANYANVLTGLCRPEELYKLVDYSNILEKETGVKIESALISDIPGYTWGIVQAYADNGIKYFSVGPNEFDRIGNILKVWGDKPFYWKSPSGEKKVLVWVAGKGYSWFHHWQLSHDDLSPLISYIKQLDAEKYPYDMVHVRYNIGGDNGFPDSALSDFVKKWNETHETPKFVLSSTMTMFKDFEKKYGSQIPTYSGDLTPYWEDGAGSTAKETAQNRNTAELLTQLENLYTLNKKNFPQDKFDEAWKYVLLFSEHTWGAWNSISDPEDKLVKDQWEIKKSYGAKADSIAQKLYADLAYEKLPEQKTVKNVRIYNSNSWERSDIVYIPSYVKTAGDYIVDERGKQIKSQRLSTGELVFVAKYVPALGSKQFSFIKVLNRKKEEAPSHSGSEPVTSLSNKFYQLSIDKKNGSVKVILVNEGHYVISDSNNIYGLNGFVYTGQNAENPVSNGNVKIIQKENGPVMSSLLIQSNAPGCNKLTRELRLFSDLEKIEIINTIDKKLIYEKENVRFAFPFNIANPETRLDIAWRVIEPEKDQLAGANKNYYTVQRWVDVSNDHIGATLATIDAPLIEVGGMNAEAWMSAENGQWSSKSSSSSLIYSWVMNNSWHTNYKAAQDGITSFRYDLYPHAKFDYSQTYRFGVEQSQPLIVVYSNEKKDNASSLFQLDENTKIVSTSFKPTRDGKAFMLRLYNPADVTSATVLKLSKEGKYKIYLSNGDEDEISEIKNKVELKPFEVRTIKIKNVKIL